MVDDPFHSRELPRDEANLARQEAGVPVAPGKTRHHESHKNGSNDHYLKWPEIMPTRWRWHPLRNTGLDAPVGITSGSA